MKRIIIAIATVLLIVGTVFAGCAKPAEEGAGPGEEQQEAAETVVWRFATFVPATDCYMQWVTTWGQYMAEKTGGRFKLYTYFADSLVKSQGQLDAVESGTADMGAITVSAWSERLPFQAPFSLIGSPLVNGIHGSMVILGMYDWLKEKYPQYVDKFYGHTKIMWMNVPIPRNTIVSNKPIHTLADLKGIKLTATSAEDIKGYTLLGAVTVPLFTGDMYMGLQTGVVDGVHGDWTMFKLWRLYEPTKYRVENTVRKGSGFPTAANWDSYNRLPADIKAIFDASYDPLKRSIGHTLVHRAQEYYFREWIEKYQTDHGNPPAYYLPDDESKQWNDMVKPVTQDWIDRTNKAGLPGTEYWAELESLATQYRAEADRLVAEFVPGYLEMWRTGKEAQFWEYEYPMKALQGWTMK